MVIDTATVWYAGTRYLIEISDNWFDDPDDECDPDDLVGYRIDWRYVYVAITAVIDGVRQDDAAYEPPGLIRHGAGRDWEVTTTDIVHQARTQGWLDTAALQLPTTSRRAA